MLLVCNSCVTRMYSYIIRMSLVYAHVLSACIHSYVTRMYSNVIVCHSYELVCHPYVTRMWFYHGLVLNNEIARG